MHNDVLCCAKVSKFAINISKLANWYLTIFSYGAFGSKSLKKWQPIAILFCLNLHFFARPYDFYFLNCSVDIWEQGLWMHEFYVNVFGV